MIDSTVANEIYSIYGNDEDMAELVTEFVAELPGRANQLQEAHAARNWEELRRAAHQLKGAGGGYGFQVLSEFAARAERAMSASPDSEELSERVADLIAICGRIRAGSASDR